MYVRYYLILEMCFLSTFVAATAAGAAAVVVDCVSARDIILFGSKVQLLELYLCFYFYLYWRMWIGIYAMEWIIGFVSFYLNEISSVGWYSFFLDFILDSDLVFWIIAE